MPSINVVVCLSDKSIFSTSVDVAEPDAEAFFAYHGGRLGLNEAEKEAIMSKWLHEVIGYGYFDRLSWFETRIGDGEPVVAGDNAPESVEGTAEIEHIAAAE